MNTVIQSYSNLSTSGSKIEHQGQIDNRKTWLDESKNCIVEVINNYRK